MEKLDHSFLNSHRILKNNGHFIISQAFFRSGQNYGKDIVNGFKGLDHVMKSKYSNLFVLKSKSFEKGDVLDIKGNVIGKHDGIINFTIGQRKGIGISHKEPLYVLNILAKENKVVVGTKEYLLIKKIYLKNINLLGNIQKNKKDLFIKVRSTGRLIKANIHINKNEAEVNLEEDEAGISPGQACVFYSKDNIGDKVLGGGWIAGTVNKYLST